MRQSHNSTNSGGYSQLCARRKAEKVAASVSDQ